MKAFASVILVPALAVALAAAGCRSGTPGEEARAVASGSLMKLPVRSYHLVYSENRGPVGYMKVRDVREAGGPVYRWSYIYDRDFNEMGWVDQFGHAFRYHRYAEGAMPEPTQPIRVIAMPEDSIGRNAMRMLGIDPSTDNVSFPLAKEGDVGTAK